MSVVVVVGGGGIFSHDIDMLMFFGQSCRVQVRRSHSSLSKTRYHSDIYSHVNVRTSVAHPLVPDILLGLNVFWEIPSAGGPLLELTTAQAGPRNSQRKA